MKVGIYVGKIQHEQMGGGHIFQINIIESLMEAKFNHEIYFYYESETNLFQNTHNIKFINMKLEKSLKLKRKFMRKKKREQQTFLDALVQRDKIDLVYYLTPACPKVNSPYVYTVWDLAHREMSFFPEVSTTGWTFEDRENIYTSMIPKSSYAVIGNNEGRRQICQYYGMNEDRVKIIPMITPNDVYQNIEDQSIITKNNLQPGKFLFYPAQYWPHKNHIRILKALKLLKEENYDYKVVFTGANVGNEKYLREKTKELGLENDVLFLGFVARAQIMSLYKNAFALVYPSFFGPDNIPPLEAMALQCPVVASGIVGMREQLKNAALFFNPTSENDMIIQIKKLEDAQIKQDLLTNGEILAKKCSVNNYVEKMIKIMDEFAPIRECWSSTEKYVG